MNKKLLPIIIIPVVLIIVCFVVWVIGYSYLSNRIDNNTRLSFIDKSMSYLSTNQEFIDKYGSLISMESEDKMPIGNKDSEVTEYYMNFTCVTEKGKFQIRVYHTWQDAWVYKYQEIDIN